MLRNRAVDFVEICNVCAKKAIIKAAKRIINFDKMCRSYSDLNFGVTFLRTQCSCTNTYCFNGHVISLAACAIASGPEF